MREKPSLKPFAWLHEPLTPEENRALNQAFALMMGSCVLLGFLPICLAALFNLPFIGWFGFGFVFLGLLWGMVGVLPLFVKITRQARKRAQEK